MTLSKIIIAVGLLVPFFGPRGFAQEAESDRGTSVIGQETAKDAVIRAFELQHADARSVSISIKKLGFNILTDSVGNTLILRGSEQEVEQAVREVVSVIDELQSHSDSAISTMAIPLGDRNPVQWNQLLSAVVNPRETRFAVDRNNQMLVATGTEDALQRIRDVVDRLAAPAQPLTAQFYFLSANIDPEKSDSTILPDGLKPVANALSNHGYTNLELLAPIIVACNTGGQFQSRSSRQIGRGIGDRVFADHQSFGVEGRASLLPGSSTVRLEIEATVQGEFSNPGVEEGATEFEVQTNVVTRLNDYVVLSAAPASTAMADAIILVVCIVPSSAGLAR